MEMLNLEKLFDNVKIENDKRLSAEDNEKMEEFRKVLADLQEGGKRYIKFYEENKLYNYDSYDNKTKEIQISILSIKDNFIEKVLFPEIKGLINNVIYYFKRKYNITLKANEHKTDYGLKYNKASAEENLNYFMNITIDNILDDIFNQLGNVSFDDKALNEVKEKLLNDCKSWRAEKRVTVKNGKISIKDFFYYDSWYKESYGYYDVGYDRHYKAINLFKLINYYNNGDLKNIYINITDKINNYQNKYIGIYEINDNILKSFKTFKNGKIELNFVNGLKALDFAKKYLGYQE